MWSGVDLMSRRQLAHDTLGLVAAPALDIGGNIHPPAHFSDKDALRN
jgi:hypothetical protein